MELLTPKRITGPLQGWLAGEKPEWRDIRVRPLNVTLGAGFSADIFFVDVDYVDPAGPQSQTLVVRRQPMDLEVVFGSSLALQGKMMAALDARGDLPVPPWIGMHLDPDILGLPFLVMGKVEGECAKQKPNYNVEGWLVEMTPAQRRQSFTNAINAFASLATIDWRDGFEFLAQPENGPPGLDQYVGALEAWHKAAGRGRAMPIVDAAMAYVRANMPNDAGVNVLWGDPTPSNVMFSADGQVNALIDWELAALGPAELDLAWWLYFDDLFGRRFGITRLEGLPTKDETIAIWEAASGRKARHLDYYDIVAALRMALVAVGAFDRQVGIGNIPATNKSLNDNFMTLYLAEKLGLPLPELGPDFVAFMKNLTPVEDKAA
ncbi:MAG: phosphotransferase family protein [Sphingobium sp.]|jgi:aminoglycoside phosphotransferase (APT) family kinase protein|uniref:Phosphotransferase family protein n=1 Tax=Sphingobium xenophagum TaxID=121428 RepID=A0A249MXR6_SPHXE|nr:MULTISPECIES: phosphotransferase family protein [Sphingobium]MBU0657468.1 phosphotransferase family protein [Alphaproteobacteria bacterium]ASY45919.1 phosphotransferase family protein [Sphingobium xenophagum]MBA4755432.1 phosphotransferase family protein [Sphingobium sp.]MBS91276.1 phosphotransferase family protein [Sphingobium sp.]MBU0867982.1 phosphotransferase family protein [Alphaproteobacteria bacterium]